jgi:glycosyltransferase involved in cell wall biosynthesis
MTTLRSINPQVLLVAPMPPPDHGGIVNWTRILLKELGKRPNIGIACVDTCVRWRTVTTDSFFIRMFGGSLQAIKDIFFVYKKIKTYRPTLLHLCTSGGPATLKDIIIIWISERFDIPSIVHYRMGRIPHIISQNNIEWRLTSFLMKMVSVAVVLDIASLKAFKKALPDKSICILPNMVDLDVIDSLKNENAPIDVVKNYSFRIVYAGHVIPTKGIRELVTSCAGIVKDNKIVLDLIGPCSDSFQEELKRIANEFDGGSWLIFKGSLSNDETLRCIMAGDIFVLPSYSEGAPNVILEAMALGKCIIGTIVGAIPEILDVGGSEECGVAIAPRDVEALTHAIKNLIANDDERSNLGCKARKRVEKYFSSEIAVNQLIALWNDIGKVNYRSKESSV